MIESDCLKKLSKSVRQDLKELTSSSLYYVTPEIYAEIRHIRNGIDHVNLDHDIIKNKSCKKNCPNMDKHKKEAIDVLCELREEVGDIKERMSVQRIYNQFDYNARKSNYLTMQTFSKYQNAMKEITHKSVDRINEYCNQIGISDRFTAYRQNLNRSNRKPQVAKFLSMDSPHAVPHFSNFPYPIDQDQQRCNIKSNAETKEMSDEKDEKNKNKKLAIYERCGFKRKPVPLSFLESCGLSTIFPQDSEYKYRFNHEARHLPDYALNPSADYNIGGRKVTSPAYDCPITSYQATFTYPDSRKIPLLPWLVG